MCLRRTLRPRRTFATRRSGTRRSTFAQSTGNLLERWLCPTAVNPARERDPRATFRRLTFTTSSTTFGRKAPSPWRCCAEAAIHGSTRAARPGSRTCSHRKPAAFQIARLTGATRGRRGKPTREPSRAVEPEVLRAVWAGWRAERRGASHDPARTSRYDRPVRLTRWL
jgi:hypothetical protein